MTERAEQRALVDLAGLGTFFFFFLIMSASQPHSPVNVSRSVCQFSLVLSVFSHYPWPDGAG